MISLYKIIGKENDDIENINITLFLVDKKYEEEEDRME
jgi:hypothetical protein